MRFWVLVVVVALAGCQTPAETRADAASRMVCDRLLARPIAECYEPMRAYALHYYNIQSAYGLSNAQITALMNERAADLQNQRR